MRHLDRTSFILMLFVYLSVLVSRTGDAEVSLNVFVDNTGISSDDLAI